MAGLSLRVDRFSKPGKIGIEVWYEVTPDLTANPQFRFGVEAPAGVPTATFLQEGIHKNTQWATEASVDNTVTSLRIEVFAAGADANTADALAWLDVFFPETNSKDPTRVVWARPKAAAAATVALPRVHSSRITVAGKAFRDWFNSDFRPAQQAADQPRAAGDRHWPHVVGANFSTVFDRLADLVGLPEVSFNGFIGYFLIGYNETAGTYAPSTENPFLKNPGPFDPDKYFFEPNTAANKTSYNTVNPAGTYLRDHLKVTLSDDDVAAWNKPAPYPMDQPDAVKTAARDCEFFRFRGRGYVQHTFRSGYKPLADMLLKKTGKSLDDITNAELDTVMKDPDVYLYGAKKIFQGKKIGIGGPDDALASLDNTPPDFVIFAKAVAGLRATAYHAKFQARAEELLAGLKAAGKVEAS